MPVNKTLVLGQTSDYSLKYPGLVGVVFQDLDSPVDFDEDAGQAACIQSQSCGNVMQGDRFAD